MSPVKIRQPRATECPILQTTALTVVDMLNPNVIILFGLLARRRGRSKAPR